MADISDTQATDALLIRAALEGRPEAFRQLVEQYQRGLFDLAARVLQDEAEAEDVVQEAFLRFYRHLSDFRVGSKLSNWLYTITLNLCRNRLRRKKIVRILSLDFTTPEEDVPSHAETLADFRTLAMDLDEKQTSELLDRLIAALPEDLRAPFLLRYSRSLSDPEIATILGLTVNHVRVLISRAKGRLWPKLQKELGATVISAPSGGR